MAIVRERLKLVGVDCPSCIYSINRELAKLRCVENFTADPSTGEAIVAYDGSICSLGDIYRAIKDAGYDVSKEVTVFVVDDLDADLARVIEGRLYSVNGVFECGASISTSMVRVVYNPHTLSSVDVERIFVELGVGFRRVSDEDSVRGRGSETVFLVRRVLAFAIGIAVVSIAIASMFMSIHLDHLYVPYLAIASGAVIVMSYDILYRGFKTLLKLSPIMDSLIALSSTISYSFGLASLLGIIQLHNSLSTSSFFEASAGVLGFVGLGLYLEERVRKRAWSDIEELIKRLYSKARIVTSSGVVEVEADKVPLEAVVEVKAGETIPVDGIVIDGEGYVDESSFTGEPIPVPRRGESRDPVLAGSILTSGYLRVRATRIGRETILYKIVETVREAQFYKPRILRLADRLVGVFTWAIIGLGIAVFIYWGVLAGDILKAIFFVATVFATACPCAIGIAIPMAVSIAIVAASRRGIVVRRGDVYDRLLETSTVIFDKTGTLTVGAPSVERFSLLNSSIDEKLALSYLCSVEAKSEHPISKAILSYCSDRGIELKSVEEFNHFPGLGVVGRVDGVAIAVGSAELMERVGVDMAGELSRLVDDVGSGGGTPILVALENRPIALIVVSDRLRPESIEVIRYLKSLGYRVGIASGDVAGSVKRYADILGVDLRFHKLKPSDKIELVKKLQSGGDRVLYVGDGVNDAAAISAAHIGIAMGGGADISKEAGDVVLTSNRLTDLVFLIKLSKKVRRKFIENLIWAFIYNIALLPIAAGALYSQGIFIRPELGALAMILSDISVVLNSLRLLRIEKA